MTNEVPLGTNDGGPSRRIVESEKVEGYPYSRSFPLQRQRVLERTRLSHTNGIAEDLRVGLGVTFHVVDRKNR